MQDAATIIINQQRATTYYGAVQTSTGCTDRLEVVSGGEEEREIDETIISEPIMYFACAAPLLLVTFNDIIH